MIVTVVTRCAAGPDRQTAGLGPDHRGLIRARVFGMDVSRFPAETLAEEALLGLLLPFWQLVIGAFVLAVVLASVGRLVRRGPSRMTTALLVTALAIAGFTVVGVLLES